jgi:predicted ATPase
LPAEVSSLVGRGPEVAAVRKRLRGGRVVTLTGPGGCGKTRLALRVTTLADGSFDDGARLVELASLTDPAPVPASVAEALHEKQAVTLQQARVGSTARVREGPVRRVDVDHE